MLRFRTEGYNGCAVKYSPFFDNRLAVAASANYGLVGNGRLFILELTPNGIVPVKWWLSIRARCHYQNRPAADLTATCYQVHHARFPL